MSTAQMLINEGIEQGMQQGAWAEKFNMAKNLKNLGVQVALIAQATGLTMDGIAKL